MDNWAEHSPEIVYSPELTRSTSTSQDALNKTLVSPTFHVQNSPNFHRLRGKHSRIYWIFFLPRTSIFPWCGGVISQRVLVQVYTVLAIAALCIYSVSSVTSRPRPPRPHSHCTVHCTTVLYSTRCLCQGGSGRGRARGVINTIIL